MCTKASNVDIQVNFLDLFSVRSALYRVYNKLGSITTASPVGNVRATMEAMQLLKEQLSVLSSMLD